VFFISIAFSHQFLVSDGVSPTAKGSRLIQRLLPEFLHLRQHVRSGISDEDWDTTIRAMQKMQENLLELG
jgi:DNA-binding MarR family transcriptional regulator